MRKPGLRARVGAGVVVLAVVGAGLGWLAWPYLWMPRGASTVSLWYAADTFDQCSRDVPTTDGKYWVPTTEQILYLEQELGHVLDERARRHEQVPPSFRQFKRQYIGFIRNGERLIYANYSPDNDFEPWRHWSPLEKPTKACDGGPEFWGFVYNPATKIFDLFDFNGVA